MKKYRLFGILISLILLFNSWARGYVSKELSSQEYERPARLNNTQVWMNGDWRWKRASPTYMYSEGNWGQPHRGRTYSNGYWKSHRKGFYWVKGRWN